MHMLHTLDVEPGGIGVTVRNGLKWADANNEDLILCVCSNRCMDSVCYEDPAAEACGNCDRQGTGKVVEIWTGAFYDVPARLIENEHEICSRSYTGLYTSMIKAYGGWTDFYDGSDVTVVAYERLT
jgi:hypothetical protein